MAKKRGVGMASILYGTGYGNGYPDVSRAEVVLSPQGAMVRTSAVDCGQGSSTIIAMIAAEVLGLAVRQVTVLPADTEVSPDTGTTAASRQTYNTGNAVRLAAEAALRPLLLLAQGRLDVSTIDALQARNGHVEVLGRPEQKIPLLDLVSLAQQAKISLVGKASFTANTTMLDEDTGQGAPYWPYAFATHIVEVEVDTATGKVEVLTVCAAHDVGKAIHRSGVEGQIAGGMAQGLGFALMEEVILEHGHMKNTSLADYLIPTALDVPEVKIGIVEAEEPSGPFGAKGVGEPALLPIAPAILNAIYDAVGVRITSLPATPEKILLALHVPVERGDE